ncbi:MAG: DUF362 domain-containing protein [Clostridia bacterium]|nr:DUF362 domain-containing protein [Clostridia bacterium]
MATKPQVFIDKCDSYDSDILLALFRERFAQLKMNEKIRPGMTVVIKPNLIMKSSPDAAAITHPEVTAAVGRVVKELGAKVLIAESSGGVFTEQSVKSVMNGCGYTAIAEKYGFEIYKDCEYQAVNLPDGKICRTLTVIKPYVNPDFVIDIAKLKTHCMTTFSGATKNLFGTVPGLMKPELHFRYPELNDFSKMLIDLSEYIRPDLCIIDGIDGMEGDGPTGGSPRHVGLVFTGLSSYAVDMVASSCIGLNPMEIRMLKEANERGLCPDSVDEIDVIGESIAAVKIVSFKRPKSKSVDFAKYVPGFLQPLVKKITTPKPKIDTKKCVGCGKCAESCPQHTIEIKDRKAVINYDKCIKCFCCHEMCPMHIIKVKRFSLFDL